MLVPALVGDGSDTLLEGLRMPLFCVSMRYNLFASRGKVIVLALGGPGSIDAPP
jgi:hypothetical protein